MQVLDVSSFESNADYTDSQFIEELERKTSAVLAREFPDIRQKQQIKKDVNGLVIACPYCRDSMRDMSKKRGHLLLSGKWSGNYKCFNCGTFTTIPKFMNDFHESLSLSGIKYVQEHKQSNVQAYNNSSSEITADVFAKNLAVKYGIKREEFKNMLNLLEISSDWKSKRGYEYLISRLQFRFHNFLYDSKTDCIVILNMCDDYVIGFQLRLLGKNVPKEKRFLTYNLNRIYKKILKKPDVEIPEDLNTISSLFGIYEVNVYKPIIVTEGPMDAFLLPNAIATCGANKRLAVELPFWYLFDADKTGQKHAIAELKNRRHVFLWGKLKNELKLPKRDKWDVNDVVLYLYQQYGKEYKLDWYKYFSDNVLDMMYLSDLTIN